MMIYRAIFSDIDGTLLNRAHQMSPRTLSAAQRVVARGIPFVLVSARPPLAMTPFTNAIGSQQPLIAFNGALILDGDMRELYSVTLANDDLRKLENLLEKQTGLSINYYQGTQWYSPDPNNYWTVQEGDITGLRASGKPSFELINVHKILVMAEASSILQLEGELRPQFPHLEIHRSKNEYLEIVNKAATKASAIRFMENKLGVSAEEVIAFGDNYNDLDMLRYAGYSVAMGNAPDDIKAQVSYVTASNAEDGLALVLESLFPE
ncbi:MAG: Cof-type HAD-IIB family hydrolase [Cardiobacteriaceae bacterium]|nr:Cof-type HAD-IIB family hydrolase [Cardiobacteriaceae bacterium]